MGIIIIILLFDDTHIPVNCFSLLAEYEGDLRGLAGRELDHISLPPKFEY